MNNGSGNAKDTSTHRRGFPDNHACQQIDDENAFGSVNTDDTSSPPSPVVIVRQQIAENERKPNVPAVIKYQSSECPQRMQKEGGSEVD